MSRAAQDLTDAGHRTSARTLARWRDLHDELYWEIRREIEANAAHATTVEALRIINARLDTLERGLYALPSG